MVIMGVDPGSRVTGYGVISTAGSRLRCLDFGAIVASSGAGGRSIAERLKVIHTELFALIKKYRPERVAVEGVFHAANVRSALTLGHARGVILLAAAQFEVPLIEYSPLEVKKAIVGYGRADKSQIQLMVKRLLGLGAVPEPHDAADALAIALCHSFSSHHPQGERHSWRKLQV